MYSSSTDSTTSRTHPSLSSRIQVMAPAGDLESSLLGDRAGHTTSFRRVRSPLVVAGAVIVSALLLIASIRLGGVDPAEVRSGEAGKHHHQRWESDAVESEVGVVAADDGRCSEVGAAALRAGGHAVDAAVAAALCLGVVHPMSSGIGGGAFMVVRSSGSGEAEAYDSRETAPAAATTDMYEKNPSSKSRGALSMGIPGELAGLHAAWSKYGRLPWKDLFQPAIKLARDGFLVVPFLATAINNNVDLILADPGLREIMAPQGKPLQTNDTCYNPALALTLEAVSIQGPSAFYGGAIGQKFIDDVRNAGGVATIEDLKRYKVKVTEAMAADAMGYRILGMPPPSAGTVGISLVLNILGSYKSLDDVKGLIGLHRLVEAFKHMFALRMDLGDPDFVNVNRYVTEMLSPSFAQSLQRKIFDNTTFDPEYYLPRWSQLRDNGTSHLCIVDADRNAVSMTTTVNSYFGSKVLSPSTGILLNNEMDDFSAPSEITPDHLPPAPANFIEPNKRPLSSMSPLIILKDNQLACVVGASGGMNIVPAITQVFLNHFVLGMEPLAAVQHPRVFHKLIPNELRYENYTAVDGEPIEFAAMAKSFLETKGHVLSPSNSCPAVSQLVVHNLQGPVTRNAAGVIRGLLTAVSDPRKDGSPAGL